MEQVTVFCHKGSNSYEFSNQIRVVQMVYLSLGSIASLSDTLYQGNPDKNHKLKWSGISTERYTTLYAGAAGTFTMGKLKSCLFS